MRPESEFERAAAAVEARLGVKFREPGLLALALTHPSWTREQEADPRTSNERLEYLGDAVLELAVARHLYETRPELDEGQLTKLRAQAVRSTSLARAGAALGLGEALRLGTGEAAGGGRSRRSNLACALEAVLGAVFLDQGWETAAACALRALAEVLANLDSAELRNWKGELQELTQPGGQRPEYRLLASGGPPHQRWFEVAVELAGEHLGQGRGPSKKDAEQQAAAAALERLVGSERSGAGS